MSIEVTQEDRDAAAEAFEALCDEPPILACEFLAPYFAAYRARVEAAATAKERERCADSPKPCCVCTPLNTRAKKQAVH